MNELPYWYKILTHFESSNYFQNGLTLPFLLGAGKVVPSANPDWTIPEFLNEINDAILPRYISIMKCENIGEYIIGVLDSFSECYIENYVVFRRLVCTDGVFSNFGEMINILEHEYSATVWEGRFSKIDGDWQQFSLTDLNRLKELF